MPLILFLTARSADADKLAGFTAGGDDWLAKPFTCAELLGRVRALLRRYCVYGGKAGAPARQLLQVGPIAIDTDAGQVTRDGQTVALTDLEYRILLLLASNRRQVFPAQDIYERVWGESFMGDTRTVDLHVQRLRHKLGWQQRITAVYKVGYRFRDE